MSISATVAQQTTRLSRRVVANDTIVDDCRLSTMFNDVSQRCTICLPLSPVVRYPNVDRGPSFSTSMIFTFPLFRCRVPC